MLTKLMIDKSKTAVMIIDYENDVVAKVPEEKRERLLQRAKKLLQGARQAGVPVIYVALRFRSGYPEVSPRNKLFSSIKEKGQYQEGTSGAEIHNEVAPQAGETVVIKRRVNAFTTTDLETILRAKGITTLVILGIITSGCVLSTMRHASDLDYEPIVISDACADRGLELPALSDETVSKLKSFLSPRSSLTNPIDMTAEASAEEYSRALEVLARDDGIDIVIVIFIPPILVQSEAVANAIRELAPEFRRRGKTLVASFMGSRGAGIEYDFEDGGCIPNFTFPENTAVALAGAYEYSQWLQRPKGVVPELTGINKEKAGEVVASALEQSSIRPLWLEASSISDLLNSYGIQVAVSKSVKTAEDAARVAEEIGFPVAVKLLSDKIIHKTEVGGVILSRHSSGEVKQAFNQIRERLEGLGRADEMQGVTIQQMISEGIEVIVGLTQDPSFGPLIMFGMGGIYAEFFKDITFRIHPLTDVDVQDMVRSVKAHQLFAGWRGSKPSDVKALEDLLLRVSAMVEDLPQIAEMDLNPVKAQEQGKGYVVVDARILLS